MIRTLNLRAAALVAATVIAFLLLIDNFRAWPHDSAEWIQRGGYKNGFGELCCGIRDCRRLDDGDVQPINGGYHIKSMNQDVPASQSMPISADGYWICVWGGQRKCFFTPMQGY